MTSLTSLAASGEPGASDRLFEAVYGELRGIAESMLRAERAGHTLQATALVHEAYMKLVDPGTLAIRDRNHFRAIAARAMGQVLIDHARSKGREKRGGGWRRLSIDDASDRGAPAEADALELHDVLERMRSMDPRLAQVVELRVFAGMTCEEAAAVLGVSARTVERDWSMGRAWLRKALAGEGEA